jgi:hypothetical protein
MEACGHPAPGDAGAGGGAVAEGWTPTTGGAVGQSG